MLVIITVTRLENVNFSSEKHSLAIIFDREKSPEEETYYLPNESKGNENGVTPWSWSYHGWTNQESKDKKN